MSSHDMPILFRLQLLDGGYEVFRGTCFFSGGVLHWVFCDVVYVRDDLGWFCSVSFLMLGSFCASFLIMSKTRSRAKRLRNPMRCNSQIFDSRSFFNFHLSSVINSVSMLIGNTAIYSCFSTPGRFNIVKLVANLKNLIQYAVNWTEEYVVNFNEAALF